MPCRGQEAQGHPEKSGQARDAHTGKAHARLAECEPQEPRRKIRGGLSSSYSPEPGFGNQSSRQAEFCPVGIVSVQNWRQESRSGICSPSLAQTQFRWISLHDHGHGPEFVKSSWGLRGATNLKWVTHKHTHEGSKDQQDSRNQHGRTGRAREGNEGSTGGKHD